MTYQTLYAKSIEQPDAFWRDAAQHIDWVQQPSTILDRSTSPLPTWFSDGTLNTAYNCLDRHLTDRAEQAAIIYDSPLTNTKQHISYAELTNRVAKFAGGLASLGVKKGDRVIIYMPMIPEAIVAMLGCARLGAIHSVVFGGFAANELASRIDDSKPDVLITASYGVEPSRRIAYLDLVANAVELSTHKPTQCVIKHREGGEKTVAGCQDIDFDQLLNDAEPHDCVTVQATDPLYILYTSGTTGKPKGVVRDNGGHAAALYWSMQSIYDVKPGDVYWAASDVGWVVGHSYIVYAPLLMGCTTILYEGKPVGTPDAGAFWRVISEHQVKVLFTAPTAIRAIKKEDSAGEEFKKYDISCLQTLFLAGERCDPDTLSWSRGYLNRPVIDHWWQTETGWAIAANPVGVENLPVKVGSSNVMMPGFDVQVLDEDGNEKPRGVMGNLAIKLPLPPSCLPTLWQDETRLTESYLSKYPGYYFTGDAGFIDEDNYLWIMSRTDDVINVAGHRLSTGGIEEVLSGHSAIAESAVFGINDDLKGQVPLGLVVLKDGVDTDFVQLKKELIERVRQQIGAVAVFKLVAQVKRLPKTRSGKILRSTMAKIANSEAWKMPATIEDAACLDEIKVVLQSMGYAK